MTYDEDNRLATWNDQEVSHDDDGNMTRGPLTSGVLGDFLYDARSRLVSADSVTSAYDAEGNRIAQTSADGTTRYTIDPHAGPLPQVLVRERPDGSQVLYVHADGVLLYEVEAATDAPRYYHGDQVGNTIAISDAAGAITDRIAYTPYGSIVHRTGTTDTPYLFGGLLGCATDPNGLVHMRARFYHPKLARFLNADPSGFAGGTNWYSYANGNPVSRVDPSGNIVETVWDIANIGMGVYSLQDNVRKGNWGWASLDAVGLVYDVVATAVPFLPAGASAGFKAARAGNSVVHSVNAGLDVARVSDRVHDAAKSISAGSMTGRQAANAGTQLHRQVAAQTSDALGYFDNAFMAGANGASGKMPDMIGSGIWADITTPGQWQKHLNSYTAGFGEGIPVFYQRGVGVIGTPRLLPGAGIGLSALPATTGGGIVFSGFGSSNSRK